MANRNAIEKIVRQWIDAHRELKAEFKGQKKPKDLTDAEDDLITEVVTNVTRWGIPQDQLEIIRFSERGGGKKTVLMNSEDKKQIYGINLNIVHLILY